MPVQDFVGRKKVEDQKGRGGMCIAEVVFHLGIPMGNLAASQS